MKFTLKDYQVDAVDDVLGNLREARDTVAPLRARLTHFSLTATTGAGKTVMAAAVIEALFYGNDEFDFEPDPGAVVLWFSDDPTLNEQTRFRFRQASSELTSRPRRDRDHLLGAEFRAGQGLLPQHAEVEQELAVWSRAIRTQRRCTTALFEPRPDECSLRSGRRSRTPSRPRTSRCTWSWTRHIVA